MRIINHAELPAETHAALESELPAHGTLLEVMQWAATQHLPNGAALSVANVITQDEYTLDIVMPWRDGLVLVYDAT